MPEIRNGKCRLVDVPGLREAVERHRDDPTTIEFEPFPSDEMPEGVASIEERIEPLAEMLAMLQPVPDAWRTQKASQSKATGNTAICLISLQPPKLGAAAYHGFIGEFMRKVAPYSEATDAGVLAHLLPAVGCIFGPGPHVWGGTEQPARLNTAVVGPTSSGRKGTAAVHVDMLMAEVDGEFWARQKVRGLSSGEGLIAAVADKIKREKDGEETVEPVEKRLLVVEPEFSKVLAQTRRDGNILSQVMREGYDSGDFGVLTRNPLHARGAHVSIVGHITPEELKHRMNAIEMANGFGNRFLWFVSRSDKVLPCAPPIPPKFIYQFATRLQAIVAFAHSQGRMALDSDAMELWRAVYPELRQERPGFAGCLTARGESIVLRLSLIYALLDTSAAIRVEHLRAALAVWKYCEESAQMLFGDRANSKLGDRLLDLLKVGRMRTTEFHSHMNVSSDELRPALAQLEKGGLVRRSKVKGEGAGRPAEWWELSRASPPKN